MNDDLHRSRLIQRLRDIAPGFLNLRTFVGDDGRWLPGTGDVVCRKLEVELAACLQAIIAQGIDVQLPGLAEAVAYHGQAFEVDVCDSGAEAVLLPDPRNLIGQLLGDILPAKFPEFFNPVGRVRIIEDEHGNPVRFADAQSPRSFHDVPNAPGIDRLRALERLDNLCRACETIADLVQIAPEATALSPNGKHEGKNAKKLRAIQTLAQHPGWTNRQLAETVGCNPAMLSRWPEIDRLRQTMNAGRLTSGWKADGSTDGLAD